MSVKRYFSFVVVMLLAGVTQAVLAQSVVDRNVTVEREFKPVIQDAGKITRLPEVLNINISKERVEYSEFQQTLPFDKGFKPLSATEVIHQRREDARDAIVRLGVGNYRNTLADLALPIVRNKNMKLDVMFDHRGTFGRKEHSLTRGEINFNRFLTRYDLYAGMGISHEYFNYYGSNFFPGGDTLNIAQFASLLAMPDPTYREERLVKITRAPQDVKLSSLWRDAPASEMLWRYNAHVGIRSLPGVKDHTYAGEVNYQLFNSQNGLQENILTVEYGFDREVAGNRFGMHMELNNLFYRQNDLPAINFWDFYAVFSMNPYYLIEREDWYVRAGFKTTFSFIHGRPFSPSPDITAELKVLPNLLSVYGGLTGDFGLSTLGTIYAENRYIFPDLRVKDTYVPFNVFMGFKLKVLPNLLVDAFLDYRQYDDQHFFVNKEYKSDEVPGLGSTIFTNRFNVAYSDATLFRLGMRANYNYRNTLNIQGKMAFNGWNVKSENYAWLKPAFEADVNADWRFNRNLSFSSTLFIQGVTYAKLGDTAYRMRPAVDMNIAASYSFSRAFSVFARLNNVFNSRYEHFYGYKVQGINMMLGGSLSF